MMNSHLDRLYVQREMIDKVLGFIDNRINESSMHVEGIRALEKLKRDVKEEKNRIVRLINNIEIT